MEENNNIKNCTCDSKCECDKKEETCECNHDTCDIKEEACECNHDTCNCDMKEETCESKKEKKQNKKKNDKVKELEEKISLLEDKILRDKAETINYRKRKEEEISRMLKYKDEDIVTEILPIIDNFESAIKMDDNNLEDEVSKFLAGFKMIYGNLITVLEHFDVKPIDGLNKPFDPTFHQAVLTEKIDGVESGIVLDVLRKGYMLKEKVIRPAMVKVSE